MSDKDRIAALEARIALLEAKIGSLELARAAPQYQQWAQPFRPIPVVIENGGIPLP